MYIDHQRTTQDLIGMATSPELIEMDIKDAKKEIMSL